MLMPIKCQVFSFSSYTVGSFIKTGSFHPLQLPLSPWIPVSGVIEEQSQWWKLWADSGGMCCKSGKQAPQLSSHRRSHGWKCHHKALLTWIPDSHQRSDPAVNFPVSVANRRPPENGEMFEILLLYFLCALWEELIFSPSSVLRLPKPNLWSAHLKFRKCVWMITFTHTAFDLLPLNYHKAVQKGASRCFLFCATVIAFLILGGEEYWYGSSGLISHMSYSVMEGGGLIKNRGSDCPPQRASGWLMYLK